jgi:hypothetical protein
MLAHAGIVFHELQLAVGRIQAAGVLFGNVVATRLAAIGQSGRADQFNKNRVTAALGHFRRFLLIYTLGFRGFWGACQGLPDANFPLMAAKAAIHASSFPPFCVDHGLRRDEGIFVFNGQPYWIYAHSP